MASDVLLETEMYFIVAMLAMFSAVGSAGNALVLYVFSATKDKLVSTLFIVVLAVVDFSTCVVIVPFTIVVELISYNVRFDLVCKLYQFLITSNIPFSALIMTAIAVDRYVSICHPFARLLTLSRARVVVLALAAVAAVLGLCGSLTHSVYQRSASRNSTGLSENSTQFDWGNQPKSAVYTGYCKPTDLILNEQFAQTFQKCYTGLFVVCLGVVVVLYTLIYLSVRRQRQKRLQMKAAPTRSRQPDTRGSKLQPLDFAVTSLSTVSGGQDNAVLSSAPSHGIELSQASPGTMARMNPSTAAGDLDSTVKPGEKRLEEPAVENPVAEAARRNRIANIKTAAMLFVVTLVFAISFFPALAMTVYLLPYNMTVFYMYFANNVANPIIYSFMNSNFQKQLSRLFRKQ